MAEKKTFVIEYDYDETRENLCEVFGISSMDLAMVMTEITTHESNSISESLLSVLNKSEKAGAILMVLACDGVSFLIKEAANPLAMAKSFLESLGE